MKIKYLVLISSIVLFTYASYIAIAASYLESYSIFMISFALFFIYKLMR